LQDPKKRATADEIVQHPWMKENGVATDKALDNVILNRMSQFAVHNKLKKEAMRVIAKCMPAEEIAGLKAIFQAIDADNSGTITAEELRSALKLKGSVLKEDEVSGLLKLIDSDENGTIEYEEFLAATMSVHQMQREENMRAAFQHFDEDGDGVISREELRKALGVSAVCCVQCACVSVR
jgi:calcium-dependent protein kinase